MENLDWFMAAACERGDTAWDSDPVEIADFLREFNEEFGWEIPIDMDEITEELKKTDNRVKEKSKLFQKQLKNILRKKGKKKCKKMIMSKRIRRSSKSSSSSTITSAENQQLNQVQGAENPNRGSREAPVLVATRTLCKTDMGDQQQRLSLPSKYVKRENLLTEKEYSEINKGIWVAARLRVPCGEENDRKYDVNLRLSQAGPSGTCYAIGKPWNKIKTENGFTVGTTLNVLAYRGKEGQLKLIFERV